MAGRDLRVQVPAGGQFNVAAAGRFVFVKSTSGDLGVETEEGKTVVMQAGDKLVSQFPAGFSGFVLHNTSAAVITAILTVGFGDYDKAVAIGNVTVSKSTGGAAIGDTVIPANSNVMISPASPARREILIHNRDNNAIPRVNIGAAAAAALGLPIMPTQTIVLTTTGSIHVYNTTAIPILISALLVND